MDGQKKTARVMKGGEERWPTIRFSGVMYRQKISIALKNIKIGQIDYLQDFTIIVHPRCVNFETEIGNYSWKTDTKTGKRLNEPIDDFNHLMDAMRYGCEEFIKGDTFSFS